MSIIEEKWEEIIDLLCTDYSVSYLSYQTWLKPMKVKDFHGDTLTISTGKEEGVAFISRKYRKQIETSDQIVDGRDQRSGSDGRINADLVEKDRNHSAHETRDEHRAQQGESDTAGYRKREQSGMMADHHDIQSDQCK